MIDSVTSSDFIVTERLHPAIIAACHGVPFIYIQTTSKARDFEQLMQVKSQGTIPASCFVDMSSGVEPLKRAYRRNLENEELPSILMETSQSISQQLQTAAAELAEELNKAY